MDILKVKKICCIGAGYVGGPTMAVRLLRRTSAPVPAAAAALARPAVLTARAGAQMIALKCPHIEVRAEARVKDRSES